MKYKAKRRVIDFRLIHLHQTLPFCVHLEDDRNQLIRVIAWCPTQNDADIIAQEMNRCLKSGGIACNTTQKVATRPTTSSSPSAAKPKRPRKPRQNAPSAKSTAATMDRAWSPVK